MPLVDRLAGLWLTSGQVTAGDQAIHLSLPEKQVERVSRFGVDGSGNDAELIRHRIMLAHHRIPAAEGCQRTDSVEKSRLAGKPFLEPGKPLADGVLQTVGNKFKLFLLQGNPVSRGLNLQSVQLDLQGTLPGSQCLTDALSKVGTAEVQAVLKTGKHPAQITQQADFLANNPVKLVKPALNG